MAHMVRSRDVASPKGNSRYKFLRLIEKVNKLKGNAGMCR